MPYYYWKALNPDGEINSGILKSQSRQQLRQQLLTDHLIPFSIKHHYTSKRLTHACLLEFTRQLTLLLQSNIPIEQALRIMEEAEKKPVLQAFFSQLRQHIQSGKPLYAALRKFPRYCSSSYCAFIQAGEETGRLHDTLRKLLNLLENKKILQSRLKKALSYPIFLLVMSLIISIGILGFIIPAYQSFFTSMGSTLPTLTQSVLTVSRYLQSNGRYFALFFLLIGILSVSAFKQPRIQHKLDNWLVKAPYIGKLITRMQLTRWSYLLATALNTQIPVLAALDMANNAISNHYLQRQFRQLTIQLSQGKSLHDSLCDLSLMNATTLQLVLIGENTGTMGAIFSQVAKNYQQELDEQLLKLTKRAEPAAILLLAGITGLIITALYLPMINLGLTVT